MLRLTRVWERVRASYWFIPGAMVLGAAALATGAEAVDRRFSFEELESLAWIYAGGPEGARAVLTTIAGSMITVAGVVFSITMVVLVLASSQFGPRILRNFMRDTGNQVVLGTFVATFLYCLLALRAVRGQDDALFIPHVSITIGVALGLASLAVLIYFIDHVATTIQAPAVVARVGAELDGVIDRAYPEEEEDSDEKESGGTRGDDGEGGAEASGAGGEAGADAAAGASESGTPRRHESIIAAERSGYLDMVDGKRLLSLATEADVVIRCLRTLGDHVLEGGPLAGCSGGEEPEEDLPDRIRATFHLSSARGSRQDVGFVVGQLAEIAVRALSTGINDPYTATNCIDRLAASLARVARRPAPVQRLSDDDGRLRVLLRPHAFPDLLDFAFDQIREYGRDSTAVLSQLLRALDALGGTVRRPQDRAALLRHADLVLEAGRDGLRDPAGQRRIEALHAAVRPRLARGLAGD